MVLINPASRHEHGRFRCSLSLLALVGAVAAAVFSGGLSSAAEPERFSGERALSLIRRQVDFGPRVPGTAAHGEARAFLLGYLQGMAERVETHDFLYHPPEPPSLPLEGTNLFASFHASAPERVLLLAHWDSRPFADRDPRPELRRLPVPGANDGASGVAVLLEMARLLHRQVPSIGVDMLLTDLEDLGGGAIPYALGAQRFVQDFPDYRPAYGILLDMVCDRNLRIPLEGHSRKGAFEVMQRIYAAAARVGADAFVRRNGLFVEDDHLPFLENGIPVANLVHAPFPPYWHTRADTPDKCSSESLQQVGDVLVELLYGIWEE